MTELVVERRVCSQWSPGAFNVLRFIRSVEWKLLSKPDEAVEYGLMVYDSWCEYHARRGRTVVADPWTELMAVASYAGFWEEMRREEIARWESVRKPTYEEYLGSSEWAVVRRVALREAGGRCEVCNVRQRLEVHHRTYDNLFEETLDDVTVLCADCHSRHHGKERAA